MTEKNLIDFAQVVTKNDRKIVSDIVHAVIRAIKHGVRYQKQVTIKDFGTFALRKRTDGTFKPGFAPAKAWIEAKNRGV